MRNNELDKRLIEIDENIPFNVSLGGKTFKMGFLTFHARKSMCYAKLKSNDASEKEDSNANIIALFNNTKTPCKFLAHAIVTTKYKGWINEVIRKIYFAYLWRFIYYNASEKEVKEALESCLSKGLDSRFFFPISVLMQQVVEMTISTEDTIKETAKQLLEQKPLS